MNKKLIIILSSVLVVIFLAVGSLFLLNSDWYINKTTPISSSSIKLSKTVTADIQTKYSNGTVLIKFKPVGIDTKLVNLAYKYTPMNIDVFTIIFLDKDNFEVANKQITLKDLIYDQKTKDYSSTVTLEITKDKFKTIKNIDITFKDVMVMTLEEFKKSL